MLLTKEEYARKRIHNSCSVRMENSVTRDNCSASRGHNSCSVRMENSVTRDNCSESLGKPRDAEQIPRGGIFNPHLTTIKDSYIVAWFYA